MKNEILLYSERKKLSDLFYIWKNEGNNAIIDKHYKISDSPINVIGFLSVHNFLNNDLIRKVLEDINIREDEEFRYDRYEG